MQKIGAGGELTPMDSKAKITGSKDGWSNDGVRTITSIACHVPPKIVDAMRELDYHFKGVEFSIFCISKWNDKERVLTVQDAIFVPTQTVSTAFVDYHEDAPEGYNTVIHKHPNGVSNFSGTDDRYINQNFDISLLWMNGQFIKGQARVSTPYGLIIIPLTISTFITIPRIIDESDMAKIVKQQPKVVHYTKREESIREFLTAYNEDDCSLTPAEKALLMMEEEDEAAMERFRVNVDDERGYHDPSIRRSGMLTDSERRSLRKVGL